MKPCCPAMRGTNIAISGIAITVALVAPAFAQPGPSVEDGLIERMVEIAFATGFGGPLSGRICTALGITTDNEPLPVEQLSAGVPGNTRSFNVSRHRGRLDVIIALKTKEETTVFLTTARGTLEKAVQEKQGEPLREIPVADAMPSFEKEKSWWLDTWLKARDAAAPNRK
jgi:hypothetical protein